MSGAIKRVRVGSKALPSGNTAGQSDYITSEHFQTTGLTGLAVSTNPHHTLGVLYNKILRVVQKMPADASYRKHTEVMINERNSIILAVSAVLKGWTFPFRGPIVLTLLHLLCFRPPW